MPYEIVREGCPPSKPWQVRKKGSGRGGKVGCHPTRESAVRQVAALEANEKKSASR